MKTDKHLDDHIRQALENLEAPPNPAGWAALEQRLDAATDVPSLNADELLASRLSNLEVSLQPGDWSLMEKLIEADETAELIENEAGIDNAFYEKLHRYEAPMQHHHWPLMARRLEEEFSLRHQLYKYKVAEIALVCLLLLTIIRYLPLLEPLLLQQSDTPSLEEQPSQPSETPSEKPLMALPAPAASTPGTPHIAAASNTGSSNTGGRKTKSAAGIYRRKAQSAKSATVAAHGPAPGANVLADTPFPVRLSATTLWLPNLTTLPIASLPSNQLTLEEKIKTRSLLKNTLPMPGVPAKTAQDLLVSLQSAPAKFAWEVPQFPAEIFSKSTELRLSIFTTSDVNYVVTPRNRLNVYDTLLTAAGGTTAASGYGGGVLLSWKKEKWELQTGGVYSFKRYVPNTHVYLFESVNYYLRENFNGIELDILEVPLSLTYHVKNEGKWRFYAAGGASSHFVTSSKYETSFQPVGALAAGLPPADEEVREGKRTVTAITQESTPAKSVFDGGILRDNLYFTVNLGLGLERYVASRWSVFMQPSYQHYLMSDGVGINRDKFYSMSFYLGTKFNLK